MAGRPRKYSSEAEKQAAYRAKLKQTSTAVSAPVMEQVERLVKASLFAAGGRHGLELTEPLVVEVLSRLADQMEHNNRQRMKPTSASE